MAPTKQSAATFGAKDLLDIGCVHFNAQTPFTFTSGRSSPIYVDIRRLISFPKQRESIVLQMAAQLQSVGEIEIVAGGETAGIPFAAWLAAKRRLPMIYVRKKPKEGGRRAQIEGVLEAGKRVALIEDLASEGSSKTNFISAIREGGGIVEHCFVVFDYGIFAASQIVADMGAKLHALVTLRDIATVADQQGNFSPEDHATLTRYINDPDDWR